MSPLPSFRLLLPLSLMVNAFLAGMLLSQWYGHPGAPPPPPPPRPERMIEDMAAVLPPVDAAILRQSFAKNTGGLKQPPRRHDDMIERMRQALDTEPFDPAALRQVFSDGRHNRDVIDNAIEAALVEAAATMSPEGRHRLASWHPPFPPPPR